MQSNPPYKITGPFSYISIFKNFQPMNHNVFTYQIKYKLYEHLFLQIPQSKEEILTFLNIENLFTHVPVYEIIHIILNNIHYHFPMLPLKINPTILKKNPLLPSATEVSFHDHSVIFISTQMVSLWVALSALYFQTLI